MTTATESKPSALLVNYSPSESAIAGLRDEFIQDELSDLCAAVQALESK